MSEEDIDGSKDAKEELTIRAACEANYANGVALLLNDKLNKNIGRFKELMGDQTSSRTLLIICAENGHADTLSVLLLLLKKLDGLGDHQQWIFSYLQRLNTYGLSALHCCTLKGYVECISVLLFFEPSLQICVSLSGQTPLDLARTCNKRESIEYLEEIASKPTRSRMYEVNRSISNSSVLKNLLSKNTLMSIYGLLPVYSYFSSLALCMAISLFLMYNSCTYQLMTDVDCHISAHSVSILMQLVIWWLTWTVRNTSPGELAAHRSNVSGEGTLEESVPVKEKAGLSPTVTSRPYIHALHRILDQSLKNKFTSSHSFCCHRCRCYRPLRSGHSRLSGRCIPLYDHFCTFLWCDVGRDNYVYFLLFLVMMCLNLPIFLILVTDHLVFREEGDFYMKDYGNDLRTVCRETVIRLFTGWCVLVLIMCFVLLVVHTRVSSLGMTSREFMKGEEKYPYLSKEHLYSHCATKDSTSRHLGVLPGYAINLLDKLIPISDDECYDDADMKDLMSRSLNRFFEWREAVSVNSLLQRYCFCYGFCNAQRKSSGSSSSGDADEKYTV